MTDTSRKNLYARFGAQVAASGIFDEDRGSGTPGIRRIIGDEDFYGSLRLLAAFCRIAGFAGLLVILDELDTLTSRLPNAKSRQGSFQSCWTSSMILTRAICITLDSSWRAHLTP